MSLFQARNTLVIVVLCAALPWKSGFTQPPAEPDAARAPLRIEPAPIPDRSELAELHVEAIREEQSRNGPHSETLIGPLTALGLLYQEQDEHGLAVNALGRALQIKRVNDGLYSLDQVPMMRALIVSERAVGDLGAVQQLEARLRRLVDRNPDDPRTVPILRESADKNLESYIRYLNGEYPPEININVSMTSGLDLGPNEHSMSNSAKASSRLRQARSDYRRAIGVLDGLYADDTLRDLEMRLIRSYYLEATTDERDPLREDSLHRLGRDAYRRLLASDAGAGRIDDVVRTLVELADWHLLFSHNGTARERYREAYELLSAYGEETTATVEELFSPRTPVVLPPFLPNPFISDPGRRSGGYVDVAFELTRYGKARGVEVLEAAPATAEASEKELIRLINTSRFRPRSPGADSPDATPLRLRYYPEE